MRPRPPGVATRAIDRRIAVLNTAYQADRADDASTNSIGLAVVSAGLVYFGVVLVFLLPRCAGGTCAHDGIPLLALVAMPLPVIAILSFFIMLGAGALIRSDYLLAIEKQLRETSRAAGVPAPDFHRRSKAVFGSDARPTFKVLQCLCYGGAFVIAAEFTIGPIWLAYRSPPHTTRGWLLLALASVGYGMALVVQLYSCARLVKWGKPGAITEALDLVSNDAS